VFDTPMVYPEARAVPQVNVAAAIIASDNDVDIPTLIVPLLADSRRAFSQCCRP
jgi:hypothetical protein